MGICKSRDLNNVAIFLPEPTIIREISKEFETVYEGNLKVFDKSFVDMLTFGFIRQFEERTNNLNIPLDIYQLCASYIAHCKIELFRYRFKFNNINNSWMTSSQFYNVTDVPIQQQILAPLNPKFIEECKTLRKIMTGNGDSNNNKNNIPKWKRKFGQIFGNSNGKCDINIEFKFVLLGAGESGKRTIFNQLKNMYHAFTLEEINSMKPFLVCNVIDSMRELARYSSILSNKGKFECKVSSSNEILRGKVAEYTSRHVDIQFTKEMCDEFQQLWNDNGIKNTAKHCDQVKIDKNYEYLFDNMNKYCDDCYILTFEDSIRSRIKFSGLDQMDMSFEINGTNNVNYNGINMNNGIDDDDDIDIGNETYRVVLTGGQRAERHNWIHCYENASVMIDVINIAGFNEFLYEDCHTICLHEDIELFGKIVNSYMIKSMPNAHVVVILNHSDRLYDKIFNYDINDNFQDYTQYSNANDKIYCTSYHGCNCNIKYIEFQKFIHYIIDKLINKIENTDAINNVHFFVICALLPQHIQFVFNQIRSIARSSPDTPVYINDC